MLLKTYRNAPPATTHFPAKLLFLKMIFVEPEKNLMFQFRKKLFHLLYRELFNKLRIKRLPMPCTQLILSFNHKIVGKILCNT